MDNEETNAGVSYERKDIRLRWSWRCWWSAGCFVAVVSRDLVVLLGRGEIAKGGQGLDRGAGAAHCRPSRGWNRSIGWRAWRSPNIDKRLAAQEKMLNSYGPTEEKGFVHIPIQQAIEAVADKLPVRKQPPGQAATTTA